MEMPRKGISALCANAKYLVATAPGVYIHHMTPELYVLPLIAGIHDLINISITSLLRSGIKSNGESLRV